MPSYDRYSHSYASTQIDTVSPPRVFSTPVANFPVFHINFGNAVGGIHVILAGSRQTFRVRDSTIDLAVSPKGVRKES